MRKWGCPKCGQRIARVTETGRDTDDHIVRLRRCVDCGTKWATEERVIDTSAFYPRVGHHFRERAKARVQGKPCHLCGQEYRIGYWRLHVQNSKVHEAALQPTDRIRRHERRYQREWKRAHSTNSAARTNPAPASPYIR